MYVCACVCVGGGGNAHTPPKLWASGQNTPELFYWPIYSLNYTHLSN